MFKQRARIFIISAITIAMLSCVIKSKNDIPSGLKIKKGVVKKIWIPDQIEEGGRVFVPGHYKFIYEEDLRWTK